MRIDNMQLNLIRTFVYVCKDKNLTLTASKLNCDPSNISKQLKQLEHEFGKKLYIGISGKRGITLTPAGELLFKEFDRAYNLLLLAEKKFKEIDGLENGKLSVGIKSDIKEYYLEQLIDQFTEKYPNLTIKLICSNSKELLKKLNDCNIDLLIDDICVDDKTFKEINIINDELCYIYNKELSFDKEIPLILPIKENYSRDLIDIYLKNNNIKYDLKYEFDNNRYIVNYVKKGYGIGIVPKKVALSTDLKLKPLKNVTTNINIIYNENNLCGSAKEFIDFIKNKYN